VAYRREGDGQDVRVGVELDTDSFAVDPKQPIPLGPESEAQVQRLIEQLKLELPGNACRVIVLTSVSAEEGVSTIAQWLSMTLARRSDQRVLHIDADFLQPVRAGGHSSAHGLIELVDGSAPASEVIRLTPLDNLHVIPRGGPSADALLRVSEDHLKRAIESLKARYDYVVIAASPVGASPFSFILSRNADGVFLIVSLGNSTKASVTTVVERLAKYGGRLLGVVINNVSD
jgi:capsular exopolysaccharide synthesis family protein